MDVNDLFWGYEKKRVTQPSQSLQKWINAHGFQAHFPPAWQRTSSQSEVQLRIRCGRDQHSWRIEETKFGLFIA